MDPQAAWDQLLSAYAEGDWDHLEDVASSLKDWLHKGGFPPVVVGDPALGHEFEAALAKAGCEFVLTLARTSWATRGETP